MSKILHFIIDGLRAEALECAHVRSLSQLMTKGVTATQLIHQGPDLTIPAMTTLFTSRRPEDHGIVTNSMFAGSACSASSLPAICQYNHLVCSVFFSRDTLSKLWPSDTMHTSVLINSQGIKNVDQELTEITASHIIREKPDYCCLYLEGADIAGTHFGYLSEPYLESIEKADRMIEYLLDQMKMVGLRDDYTIVISASQSGTWEQSSPEKIYLPFIVSGKGIEENLKLEHQISFLDITPTLCHILKMAPHPSWQGQVIKDIFIPVASRTRPPENNNQIHLLKKQIRPAA